LPHSVLFGAFLFPALATIVSLPVSTTHAIVGSLVCVGIVAKGFDSVGYNKVILSVIAWVISPIAGGIIGWALYWFIHKVILSSATPDKRARFYVPIFTGLTAFVLFVVLFLDGPDALRPPVDTWINLVAIVAVCVVISIATVYFLRFTDRNVASLPSIEETIDAKDADAETKDGAATPPLPLEHYDRSRAHSVAGSVAESVASSSTAHSGYMSLEDDQDLGAPDEDDEDEVDGEDIDVHFDDVEPQEAGDVNDDDVEDLPPIARALSGENEEKARSVGPTEDGGYDAESDDDGTDSADSVVNVPALTKKTLEAHLEKEGGLSAAHGEDGDDDDDDDTVKDCQLGGKPGEEIEMTEVTEMTQEEELRSKDPHRETRLAHAESRFRILMVATAMVLSFSHGANNVANAIGPYGAIIEAEDGEVGDTTAMPLWVTVMGAVAIVIGLATYGYKVIETVGKKITTLTYTKGFCAQFGAATTALVCTTFGIPMYASFPLVFQCSSSCSFDVPFVCYI
jgi:phosphate/sulfate permease